MLKQILERKLSYYKFISSSQSLPSPILILLTIQRSGSTWLFDLLRAHPAIEIYPKSVIWDAIGFKGRRYPRDLSGGNNARLNVEVQTGNWEKIPDFTVINTDKNNLYFPFNNTCFIEKAHPHFFNYNSQYFIEKITSLSKKSKIKLIYHVRSPQEVIRSFISYQQRNPNWYPHLDNQKLLKHLELEYHTILNTARELDGLVTSYSDLQENSNYTFNKILNKIFDTNKNNNTNLIEEMKKITSKKVRQSEHDNTPFLGFQECNNQLKINLEEVINSDKQKMNSMEEIFESILELKSSNSVN